MKKRVIAKGIINYIFAMVFAIIFGLFLNADVGWFILLTLVLAPLMSVFLAWFSSRMLQVSCEMEEALLSKGDTCTMTIRMQNRSIFPTPPIAVTLTNGAGARSDNPNLLVSVISRASQEFDVSFRAKICGKSMVGIETLRVTDYLGLFSFAVKNVDYTALQKKVAVIPNIAEISARDDNIVKMMQTSQHLDDSEETVEASANSFGGFPGYDNREYVPGDPLKRINWKQSAKRNKLLVRLDDEMSSQSVNVVLDSVFLQKAVDIRLTSRWLPYRGLTVEEICPKMAEDAVENALGIMRVLIRHNYTIHFYAMFHKEFVKYEVSDEIDLENIRLELAHYSFYEDGEVDRLPAEDTGFSEKVGVFSTPNSYENAYAVLESGADIHHTSVYSVQEEAKKLGNDDSMISLQNPQKKQQVKERKFKKVFSMMKPLVLPYLLALLLSIAVFGVFDVPVLSGWTVVQMIVCAVVIAICEYAKNHRLIGTLVISVLVMADLYAVTHMVFTNGVLNYFYWFVSGGDEIESTVANLSTLVMIFTAFFAAVVYYFIRVLYRTSFLMLVSLLPFVVYVKVMLDIPMVLVVFVTVLNVVAFLLNTRTQRDKGKRIVGYVNGLLSLGLYGLMFVLIGLAVPEAETKYYYMFENAFLGGNITEKLPQEYSEMSEYSGNADGFNELNDRKLYVITGVEGRQNLYMKRQTFDLYDFKMDRWYADSYYKDAVYSQGDWRIARRDKNLIMLSKAIHRAGEYAPEFLEEYGLQNIPEYGDAMEQVMKVETQNFPSVAYITPPQTLHVNVEGDEEIVESFAFLSRGEVFQNLLGFLGNNIVYTVVYRDEVQERSSWISAGGANYDLKTAGKMLQELQNVLEKNGEADLAKVAETYLGELNEAVRYQAVCAENTEQIPKRVKKLAEEITKDCTYDWEKAAALQQYFGKNGFIYDLSYDAPDDSVEYFLFEGKTGTCSDYASAFALMARSVGLVVRYAEGFVPDEEYNGDYVIRTDCGHAYPEVYLPNVGFVVYEATLPAGYGGSNNRAGMGFVGYFMMVGIQALAVFGVVSLAMVVILFLYKIVAPYISETYFLSKWKKEEPGKATIRLYQRIQQKETNGILKRAGMNTPYEYAERFEEEFAFDISELTYLVEQAAYAPLELNEQQKRRAKELYEGAKAAVKERKKQKKR